MVLKEVPIVQQLDNYNIKSMHNSRNGTFRSNASEEEPKTVSLQKDASSQNSYYYTTSPSEELSYMAQPNLIPNNGASDSSMQQHHMLLARNQHDTGNEDSETRRRLSWPTPVNNSMTHSSSYYNHNNHNSHSHNHDHASSHQQIYNQQHRPNQFLNSFQSYGYGGSATSSAHQVPSAGPAGMNTAAPMPFVPPGHNSRRSVSLTSQSPLWPHPHHFGDPRLGSGGENNSYRQHLPNKFEYEEHSNNQNIPIVPYSSHFHGGSDPQYNPNPNLPVSLPYEEEEVPVQKPKKKKLKKSHNAPRYPLSAYNFFFSEEREVILALVPEPDELQPSAASTSSDTSSDGSTGAKEEPDAGPLPNFNNADEDIEFIQLFLSARKIPKEARDELKKKIKANTKRIIDTHVEGDRLKKSHKKSHGLIAFQILAKVIGHRWRSISDSEKKQHYFDLAKQDLDRYKKQLKEYEQAAANQK